MNSKGSGILEWLVKLKEMKQSSGLTTKEISDGSGIPEPTLEKLFSGATKDPKLNTVMQLVHFLGYTLDDLVPAQKKAASIPDESEVEAASEKLYMALLDSGFLEPGEDLTPKQIKFLFGISSLLRAFFQEDA